MNDPFAEQRAAGAKRDQAVKLNGGKLGVPGGVNVVIEGDVDVDVVVQADADGDVDAVDVVTEALVEEVVKDDDADVVSEKEGDDK